MSSKMTKAAVAATAALMVPGAAMAAEPVSAPEVHWTTVAAVQPAEQQFPTVKVASVEGAFGFNQAEQTPNAAVKAVFQKGATLCSAIIATGESVVDMPISVGGDVPAPFTATVDEMTDEAGSSVQLMGCSCTANPAGGWAVASSQVEGVSIADMLSLAGL